MKASAVESGGMRRGRFWGAQGRWRNAGFGAEDGICAEAGAVAPYLGAINNVRALGGRFARGECSAVGGRAYAIAHAQKFGLRRQPQRGLVAPDRLKPEAVRVGVAGLKRDKALHRCILPARDVLNDPNPTQDTRR